MHAARSLLPLPVALAALVACGGSVLFEEGDGGVGGAGSGGVTTSSSTSSDPTTSGGPVATVGAGGAPSGVTTTAGVSTGGNVSTGVGGSGGGGGGCSANDTYVACLGAAGACVPLFDDLCCSSCYPGECADCVDLRFVACVDRLPPEPGATTCVGTSCGFAPDWACEGEAPRCAASGCSEAGCVQKIACGFEACEVWCDGVGPDACGEVFCDAPPPPCNDDQAPEVSNGCWTGACIPAWVCQPQPPLF